MSASLAIAAHAKEADYSQLAQDLRSSLVQLRITSQDWHPRLPWRLGAVRQLSGVGVVVGTAAEPRILVQAQVLQDARLIEVFLPTTRSTATARLVTLDRGDNLALLTLEALPQNGPLPSLTPIALGVPPKKGDTLLAAQLERGTEVTLEPMTAAEHSMAAYPLPGVQQLTIETEGKASRDSAASFMPVFAAHKTLVSLMLNSKKSEGGQLIATEVIARFLQRAQTQAPAPTADNNMAMQILENKATLGLRTAPLQDPSLRQFVGLPSDQAGKGLYISAVQPGGVGQALGLRAGDVLLTLAGKTLQDDGFFQHERYGPLHFSYLLSTQNVGDALSAVVWRQGQRLALEGQMPALNLTDSRLPIIDPPQGPRYVVYGGMVFLEVSLPWLLSFGDNWEDSAPLRVLYTLSQLQQQEQQSGKRITDRLVILSSVLPMPSVQGYQDLGQLRVLQIDGKTITRLEDVATALQATPAQGVHRMALDDFPSLLEINHNAAMQDNRALEQAPWQIPNLSRF